RSFTARLLREVDVQVDVREYEGAPHMFLALDNVLESGRRAVKDLVGCVKETLAEYLEDSVIKPIDIRNKFDRQNLLEQGQIWERWQSLIRQKQHRKGRAR